MKFSSRKELVKSHQVQSLYEGIVEELNQNLAQYEKLKKVLVVPDELSIADGTLTPSMKLRRRHLDGALQERNRRALRQRADPFARHLDHRRKPVSGKRSEPQPPLRCHPEQTAALFGCHPVQASFAQRAICTRRFVPGARKARILNQTQALPAGLRISSE